MSEFIRDAVSKGKVLNSIFCRTTSGEKHFYQRQNACVRICKDSDK